MISIRKKKGGVKGMAHKFIECRTSVTGVDEQMTQLLIEIIPISDEAKLALARFQRTCGRAGVEHMKLAVKWEGIKTTVRIGLLEYTEI